MLNWVFGAAGLVIGCIIGFFIYRTLFLLRKKAAKQEVEEILRQGRIEAENIIKEGKIQARDQLLKMRNEFEKETREKQRELQKMERRLFQKEENLDKKLELLERKENDLRSRQAELEAAEKGLKEKESNYNELISQCRIKLEEIARMTADQAKQQLLKMMEDEARHDAAKMIKKIEEEAREEADKKAKKIIADAIQRYAGEYSAESTVSVVALPDDEMKGRIIGREGRNIRTLEAATGIDIIIDDTPEAVVLSGFNPLRRQVAKRALEKLIADGRIHPARIEEVVKKAEKEVEQDIKEAGQQAIFDLGIHGMHPELVRLVGSLKYRTSYTQNQYQHSMEVAFLAGMMASYLGVNVKVARRAGLLHDIGKALDHEIEGSHAAIGAEYARKYGESEEVCHAIAAHHEPGKIQSLLDIIVQAADAISGARPGARREMLESYIKRLEDLERIAQEFEGVERAFAIQAGREVRVIVEGDKVSDENAIILSKDIARKIESEMTYPGQIRVTVIRETRAVEYAK